MSKETANKETVTEETGNSEPENGESGEEPSYEEMFNQVASGEEPEDEPEPEGEEDGEAEGEPEGTPEPKTAEKDSQPQGKKRYTDEEWIQAIPEEYRDKVRNLANTAQSHYNRVFKLEHDKQQYQNFIEQMRAQQQSSTDPAKQETTKEDPKPPKELETLKQELGDEFSDALAAAVQYEVGKSKSELEKALEERLAPISQKMESETQHNEIQRLETGANELFETERTGVSYQDVVASEDFRYWLADQPPRVQNLLNSDSADDVLVGLTKYEHDYQKKFAELKEQGYFDDNTEETPTANSQERASASQQSGDDVRHRRQQALDRNQTDVSPSRSGKDTETDTSYEALFNQMAKKKQQQASGVR